MSWTLIVVFVAGTGAGGTPGAVAQLDMANLGACLAAAKTFREQSLTAVPYCVDRTTGEVKQSD